MLCVIAYDFVKSQDPYTEELYLESYEIFTEFIKKKNYYLSNNLSYTHTDICKELAKVYGYTPQRIMARVSIGRKYHYNKNQTENDGK